MPNRRRWPALFGRSVTIVAISIGMDCQLQSPAAAVDPAVEVAGGGSPATDCYATFKANATIPSSRPRRVQCVDGDPACDADATVDGVCTFDVAICTNSTFDPRCSSPAVESVFVYHSLDDGTDPDFHPDLQALQSHVDTEIQAPTAVANLCTTASTVRLRVAGPVRNNRCRKARKTLRMIAVPQGGGAEDRDALRLTCLPADAAQNGCDPMTLFVGTFDRLEKQVFTQSCGVSTCHDSETTAADLLLESGAAYTNLVNVEPTNLTAHNLGWKRVTPGDASTSLLYHKVTNDLAFAPGLGLRMPRPPRRRRLDRSLQEIIRLWIEAGAPDSGWVPGTF